MPAASAVGSVPPPAGVGFGYGSLCRVARRNQRRAAIDPFHVSNDVGDVHRHSAAHTNDHVFSIDHPVVHDRRNLDRLDTDRRFDAIHKPIRFPFNFFLNVGRLQYTGNQRHTKQVFELGVDRILSAKMGELSRELVSKRLV